MPKVAKSGLQTKIGTLSLPSTAINDTNSRLWRSGRHLKTPVNDENVPPPRHESAIETKASSNTSKSNVVDLKLQNDQSLYAKAPLWVLPNSHGGSHTVTMQQAMHSTLQAREKQLQEFYLVRRLRFLQEQRVRRKAMERTMSLLDSLVDDFSDKVEAVREEYYTFKDCVMEAYNQLDDESDLLDVQSDAGSALHVVERKLFNVEEVDDDKTEYVMSDTAQSSGLNTTEDDVVSHVAQSGNFNLEKTPSSLDSDVTDSEYEEYRTAIPHITLEEYQAGGGWAQQQ
ncbi:hypothetical protein FA15DRAFT_709896 [Coprinopsis marcescibilis]|uniref:Uncharacterized protein n=1 Tax=Coprinopsis marcescibilis TaxID=230819 RepID=A0A5C3KEQ8_COPMA|nr:hypothetical protein FA15DRAFT_709896 [Coprinopsis marcescibilis]